MTAELNVEPTAPGKGKRWGKVRLVLVLLVVFALVAVLGWVFLRPAEPTYAGQPLSVWCEQVNTYPPNEKAIHAVQQIGTNAIPWLLRDLRTRGSVWYYRANTLLARQQLIKFRFPDLGKRYTRGAWGFFALGPQGRSAVPELEKMMADVPGYVPWALAGIGHDAVPTLCRGLTNAEQYVVSNTAGSIANAAAWGHFTTEDLKLLLPLMQAQAKSTNTHIQSRTLSALKVLQSNGQLEGELAKYKVE